ncbi:MAG TPA: alpha/beta hydrolase-fold protein [Blastocatellia bacterium]|nr:alpha/beta hydrolase-fold protein [Blastocatellia bacterium]
MPNFRIAPDSFSNLISSKFVNRFRNTAKAPVIGAVLLLSTLVIFSVISCGQGNPNQTPNRPPQQQLTDTALVQYKSFHSDKLGRDVQYAVQLPPSYATSQKRYPVLIFLHGLFEDAGRWNRHGADVKIDALRSEGKIGEMIIVIPSADRGLGLYTDSSDGKNLWEQAITVDLVKHIDQTYRTMPGAAHRAIGGISLGGWGALKIAFRHPEMFGAVITHCAALLPDYPPKPSTPNPRSYYGIFSQVFGEPYNKEMWDNNDPAVLAKKNAAAIKKSGLKIYFDCGTEDSFQFFNGAKALDAALTSVQIPHEFHLFPGAHGWEYTLTVVDHSFPFAWQAIK